MTYSFPEKISNRAVVFESIRQAARRLLL